MYHIFKAYCYHIGLSCKKCFSHSSIKSDNTSPHCKNLVDTVLNLIQSIFLFRVPKIKCSHHFKSLVSIWSSSVVRLLLFLIWRIFTFQISQQQQKMLQISLNLSSWFVYFILTHILEFLKDFMSFNCIKKILNIRYWYASSYLRTTILQICFCIKFFLFS